MSFDISNPNPCDDTSTVWQEFADPRTGVPKSTLEGVFDNRQEGVTAAADDVERLHEKDLSHVCDDCGADISHRGRNAKRCESCAEKSLKQSTRESQARRRRGETLVKNCTDCKVPIENPRGNQHRCETCRVKALAAPIGAWTAVGKAAARQRKQNGEPLRTRRTCANETCGADISPRVPTAKRCAPCPAENRTQALRAPAARRG